jgi:hypothetical protein
MLRRGARILILSRNGGGKRTADEGKEGSPNWGLGQDSRIVEALFREVHSSKDFPVECIFHEDPQSFYGGGTKPRQVDLTIHLEVPCRAAFPWSTQNWVIVNPEWWPTKAWDWVLEPVAKGGADMILFKSEHARALYPTIEATRCKVMPWRFGPEISTALSTLKTTPSQSFLFMIGASAHKQAAAEIICKAWKSTWPPLLIVATDTILEGLQKSTTCPNISFHPPYSSNEVRSQIQTTYGYHIVASTAEGFGYTFAEAAAIGALPLWTDIPVYKELYAECVGTTGMIETTTASTGSLCRDPPRTFTEAAVVKAVENLLSLKEEDATRLRGHLKHVATTRVKEFRTSWKKILNKAKPRATTTTVPLAPLPASELPHVAVVTLTYNRPGWFANMAQNIMNADYPHEKLTWIVADDSDASGRVDEQIMRFQSVNPKIHVIYQSIPKRMAIGAKRNKACDAAPTSASVFVMMDDDDHYPAQSIANRVAWLHAGRSVGIACVSCAVLPMYHSGKYVSAINVPPLALSPAERVSEATLCFTREFYTARKFPAAVSVAEGEGFIDGRVEQTREIPPEGVIVSFLHGKNATSRRVPDLSEPNGCHYGFSDEYFEYVSKLALD